MIEKIGDLKNDLIDLKGSLKQQKSVEKNTQLKDKLFDFWNGSKEYFQEASNVNKELTDERKKMLQYITSGMEVLDVACGTAENSIYISKVAKYFGIDISNVAIEMAQKYKNDNVQLMKADVANIPFENNSFDVVISTYAIEHFLEPEKIQNHRGENLMSR